MEADLRATAARLDAAKNEAERANAVKSRFLAAASHDLRQPLQAATIYLSLLTRPAQTADQQETCAKMRAPLEVMRSILDALLDISLLDSGSVTVRRTNFALAPLLERVGNDLRSLAQQKNLRFDCVGTAAVVYSDLALLERIVENLASNAIRYTVDGGVTVRADNVDHVAEFPSRTPASVFLTPRATTFLRSIFSTIILSATPRRGWGLVLQL